MVVLYVSYGPIGKHEQNLPTFNKEFEGADWSEAWAKVNDWMIDNRLASYWYLVFA